MEDRPRDGSMYENPQTRTAVALCPRDIVIALIALTDTEITGAQTQRPGIRRGQVWRREISDICFALEVDRPPFRIDGDRVSSAAAAEMNLAAEQMARAKYPKSFVVHGVIFCERGQASLKNILSKIF